MATPLEEALTAVGASALVQKRIDPNLLEYQRRYAPLVRVIPTVSWNSTAYYFNNRTQNPAGGFVTDGGYRPVSTSTYNQNLYPIKLLQTVGAVTGYAQQVTADLIGNLRAKEIMGAARRLYWSVENAILWGNAASTLYGPYPEFDGLDTLCATFSGVNQNAINFGGNPFSLGACDQLIDLVENNVAQPLSGSDWMFVMSPTAESRLAQLFTNQQRFINPNMDSVEVATGLNVSSYRDIPIIKSSFLAPTGNQMSAVTAAGVSSGGALANGTYYYYVSAVIDIRGETLVQASECSANVTGSGVITLSFTAYVDGEGNPAATYKVYRATSSGAETFLGYVDANITPNGGTTLYQTNQIIDNGTTLIPQQSVGSVQNAQNPANYAAVGANTSLVPLVGGGQNVYLLSRDSDFIVRPYVREFTPVDVYPTTVSPDSLPFATVTDTTLALRAPKYIGRLSNLTVTLSN